MDDLRGKTVAGTFCHAPRLGALEILKDALVALDGAGAIAAVIPAGDARHATAKAAAARAGTLVTLPAASVVLPGFVDLHIHAPQYPQLGTALDVPLEVWLQRHTFPLEARYADVAFARSAYEALVGDLIAHGTTTAVYYATIHQEATRILVDTCLAHGQRAFVGKVAMDNPAECPDFYRDASAAAALDGTTALIDYVRRHPENSGAENSGAENSGAENSGAENGGAANAGLVQPIVTPRFIPSCTDALLEGLGAIAKAAGVAVQTHCSESDWQHGYVQARHGMSDAESLDRFGLLARRTVLAHANMLSPADMTLVAARGAGVAHCPLSNIYFSNAVFPLRAALTRGLRVGLGTDISGGPSAAMLEAARMAVHASRLLEEGVDPALPPERRGRAASRIDFRAALHLATAGGADVLDLAAGRFAPGCRFDAVLVDPDAADGTVRRWDAIDSDEDLIQKIVFTASRANIAQVWIDGQNRKPGMGRRG